MYSSMAALSRNFLPMILLFIPVEASLTEKLYLQEEPTRERTILLSSVSQGYSRRSCISLPMSLIMESASLRALTVFLNESIFLPPAATSMENERVMTERESITDIASGVEKPQSLVFIQYPLAYVFPCGNALAVKSPFHLYSFRTVLRIIYGGDGTDANTVFSRKKQQLFLFRLIFPGKTLPVGNVQHPYLLPQEKVRPQKAGDSPCGILRLLDAPPHVCESPHECRRRNKEDCHAGQNLSQFHSHPQ